MTDIAFAVLGISILFGVFVTLRSVSPFRACALCAAVSLSWIALLARFYLGYTGDPLLIGILMGGSVVGVLYLLGEKLPERLHLFKLPFFLTLIVSVYFTLTKTIFFDSALVVGIIWLSAFVLYVGRNKEGIKAFSQKIIECCKNW